MSSEKISTNDAAESDPEQLKTGEISDDNEALEVFQKNGEVNFRNVGWIRCTTIFLKIIFSTGVLGIPVALSQLGAVGGALSLVGWAAINTYNGTVGCTRTTIVPITQLMALNRCKETFAIVIEDAIPSQTWLKKLEAWF